MRWKWQIPAMLAVTIGVATLTAARGVDLKEAPIEPEEAQVTVLEADPNSQPRANVLTSPTLVAEMDAARAAYHEQLELLASQFREEHDPARSMELQRKIEALKLDTELGYLEIQARHARAIGMVDLADKAESMLASMKQRVAEEREARAKLAARPGSSIEEKVER